MNNKRYGYIIAGIAFILVLIMIFDVRNWFSGYGGIEIPEEYADDVIIYENGDYIYIPGEEHLAYDEDEYLIYYNNEILVYTEADLNRNQKQELADEIEGVIVGEVSGYVNMLQIAFAETDYQRICEKRDVLLTHDTVVYAGCDIPLETDEFDLDSEIYIDENPWSANGNEIIAEKGNEGKPSGNDWWAEAIGAYTAWRYGRDASPVEVGIIDSGFDLEHEEFTRRISLMENYPANIEESLHGTSVTGIIGAADNDVGLHGIHSGAKITCIDMNSNGESTSRTDHGMNVPVVNRMFSIMAANKIKVVNLSWGLASPVTGADYANRSVGLKENNDSRIKWGRDYEEYLEICRRQAKESAEYCIIILDQMVKSDNDILFVQAAGNGWGNGGTGHDSFLYGGFFDSVTRNVYDNMTHNGLVSYEEIKEHILVVGAVDNVRNEEGDYQMTRYSSHGESLDICAPGGLRNIFTTTNRSNGSGYTAEFWGTSAAAPMVTGSVALLWGINPDLTAAQVKDLLLKSATSDAFGYYFDTMRYPMLNIGNAAKKAYELVHPEEFIDTGILSDWLEQLAEEWGVIEVGTEGFASKNGGFEHVVPISRIFGLLAAEMDDYDGDGNDELFVVRVEPESYQVGAAQETSTTYITLEVYDVKNGEVFCSGKMFPLLGMPETQYQTSFHVFKTTDGERVKFYFDYFFNFNSQTFGMVQLEYDGDGLQLIDGAEMDEYAYSAGCWQAFSDEACDTILGRQSFDIGQAGWEEIGSKSWGEYFEDEELEDAVTDILAEYSRLLRNMGLTDTVTRSMYASTNGSIHTSLQDIYSRCSLEPAEHYTYDSGSVESICSMITPSGQGSVTLTVVDYTSLLYPYRKGERASEAASDQTTDSHDSSGNNIDTEIVADGKGYDSARELFYVFTDILMNGSAEDIISLYSDIQLSYEAEAQGHDSAYLKTLLMDSWEDSWKIMTDSSTWQYELKEIIDLDNDEIYEKFGNNDATPDKSVKLKIVAKSIQDKTFYIYAVCYGDRWYLSVINN